MKARPCVSVIIPVYNSVGTLTETLHSCLVQQEWIHEIILVDDFSTDASPAIAADFQLRFPEYVKVYPNAIKGGNNARNLGFAQATGEFIQWLDADDQLLHGKLARQVSFLEDHPAMDIAYSDWQLDIYDEAGNKRTELKVTGKHEDYLLELLKDNWLPPHAYLLRKQAAAIGVAAGGWNQATRIAQDREYFTLCAIEGLKFGYVPGNCCIYNRFIRQVSVSKAMNAKERASHVMNLLHSFYQKATHADFPLQVKRCYERVIITQLIYYSAIYNLPFFSLPVSFTDVDWRWIKGIRSTLKVILRILKIKYGINVH